MAATRPRPPAPRLDRGDLLPKIRVAPPGPRCRAAARAIAACEAPGANTLYRGQPSLVWQEACGANVLDLDCNRYLDFTSGFGVALVGHRNPRVVAALARQSRELLHGLGDVHSHPARIALAQRLAALAPFPDPLVHFAISGADAVELAVATAMRARSRHGVLAFDGGYHGLTFGALALTSRPAFREPFAAALNPHVDRLPYGGCLDAVAARLGRGDLACLVVEPILGREGVVAPPPGWLATLGALAAAAGVVVVADEILTGGGRCGSFWASSAAGFQPDLICCGKALGGGLPLAAVIGRGALMRCWETGGEALRTATFLAHPLACAAALAALEVIARRRLPQRAVSFDGTIRHHLAGWQERHPGLLREVRGGAAFWGLVFADAPAATSFVQHALARGVILLAGGPGGNVAQLLPPLTITDRQLAAALGLLTEALAATAADHPHAAPAA